MPRSSSSSFVTVPTKPRKGPRLAYRDLRRMQQVHRALRMDPPAASVLAVASRYGIRALGRFAASYRARYG